MIKTLFLAGDYLPDACGVVHYTERLRHELSGLGVESSVLTSHHAARKTSAAGVSGVTGGWGPGCLGPLLRAIRRAAPDVLHLQFAPGSYRFKRAITFLPLLLRASRLNVPIVTTVHEYGGWEWKPGGPAAWASAWLQGRGWWDPEAAFVTPMSDAVILTNDDPAPLLLSRLPHVAGRLARIPIGTNIDRVPCSRAQARQTIVARTRWPEDSEVLSFFGFIHPVKGLETLLRAFACINARRPATRLLLIGGWESLALAGREARHYIDSLRHLAGELDLRDVVHFTGHVPDREVSLLLSGSELGVLPFNHGASLKSGSLLTVLAHGLPTVTTEPDSRIPHLSSVAELVQPRRAGELAEAMMALLEDPARRSHLSAAGQAFITPYNWNTIARRHVGLYRRLLSGTREDVVQESVPRAEGDSEAGKVVTAAPVGWRTDRPTGG